MQFKAASPSSKATGASRIMALDLMRGYLILVIASVHLAYYPSLFGTFTGRGQLWVSEAEGFFLISGLLIGLIRRKDIERGNLGAAVRKVLARGWRLYSAGIILTVLYQIIGRSLGGIFPDSIKGGLDTTSSILVLTWKIVSLQYSYGWSDFLIYYAGFLALAPLVLWALKRGWWYLVVAASLAIWTWRWFGGYGPYDSFLQWQVYFFIGSVLGYHWNTIITWFNGLPHRLLQRLQITAILVSVVLVAVSVGAVFGPQSSGWTGALAQNQLLGKMLTDGRIGLLRPLLTLLYFAAGYIVVRHYEAVIVRRLGWLLLPFGMNSLYVYILDSALLFTIPFFVHASGYAVNSLIELGIVTVVWLAIRSKFLFRIIPR